MKEELLATSITNFVSEAANEELRLDGRDLDDFRNIEVHFGKEFGSCQVSFGETKVLAYATCDVTIPKATRPNEGLLLLNVELSPMAAVHFETGPPSDLSVHLNRLLEKFFKESRCVDLESLCIVAEEKVWNLRVDINVLNSDGNLIGCCSAAALAALMHFRRPDFSLSGEQVVIHSAAERDPLPITLHHHPVAVTFAIFHNGSQLMVDPTNTEERVSQGQLVLAVNTYRELCGLNLSGSAMVAPDFILSCAHRSNTHVAFVAATIKLALEADLLARKDSPLSGLASCIHLDRILSSSLDRSTFHVKGSGKASVKRMDIEEEEKESDKDSDIEIVAVMEKTAELRPVLKNKLLQDNTIKPWQPSERGNQWLDEEHDDFSSEEREVDGCEYDGSDSEVEVVKQITIEDRVIDNIELSGDSEEEETVVLNSSEVTNA